MKNKQNQYARLKHGIFAEKEKGKKEIIRKLRPDEVEFLNSLVKVEPYLYEIKLNFPMNFNPKTAPSVVKDLFFTYKKNNKYIVIKRLNHEQLKGCRRCGLEVKEYKYRIRFY
jgi:hypothetical protein